MVAFVDNVALAKKHAPVSAKPHTPWGRVQLSGLRYYNPEQGRWVNRDRLGEIDTILLYAAMGNATVNAVDPKGESRWWRGRERKRKLAPIMATRDVGCCEKDHLNAYISEFRDLIDELQGRNNKDTDTACLGSIDCGDCGPSHCSQCSGSGGYYVGPTYQSAGKIVMCSTVTRAKFRHELEHAHQCYAGPSCETGQIEDCRRYYNDELRAYTCQHRETVGGGGGGPCNTNDPEYSKKECLEWVARVLFGEHSRRCQYCSGFAWENGSIDPKFVTVDPKEVICTTK